jgi:hypothetical protein
MDCAVSRKQFRKKLIEVPVFLVVSIHRNTPVVLQQLTAWSKYNYIDVLIAGAGMANHLTGICDAYLRYTLENDHIVVVGVAFSHENPMNTKAAIMSITQVPGTQVVFDDFVGLYGFHRACVFAVTGELPQIKLPEPKIHQSLSLADAIALSEKKS